MNEAYERLLRTYGPQGWWPAETDEEVVIGAVLTQAVSWGNVERAIANLRQAGLLSLGAIAQADPVEIAPLVRPAGYFNLKAKKLQAVARFVYERGFDALDRDSLLAVYGIGPETADAILCYACGQPRFVADAYSRRVGERMGWLPRGSTYEQARVLFEAAFGDVAGEMHALLVRLCKECCHKRRPRCGACPLNDLCPKRGVAA